MLVPELLLGFPGLTLDLTCSLPEDGWTVDETCYHHQYCPACPAEVLWDCALLVRMLPLPALWAPSTAALPFLVEQPCSCCSLKFNNFTYNLFVRARCVWMRGTGMLVSGSKEAVLPQLLSHS